MRRRAEFTEAERQKICRLYREEKLSIRLLSVRFDCTEVAIQKVLRAGGVSVNSRNNQLSRDYLCPPR